MARGIGAGIAELWHVTTIATPSAPTAAELNAGTDLTLYLTDGGLTTDFSGSIVDAADMSSAFNKTASGTYGGQPLSCEFFRDLVQASDTAYTTLPRGTVGFFAIVRRGLATKSTFAIGDDIDIWPIDVVSRNELPLERNTMQRFEVMCAVTDEPDVDVAVV